MRARIENAAGSLKTTQATASYLAPYFVAACARPERAKADFGFQLQDGTPDREAKRFASLKAQFAKHGHALHQSGPGDGPGPVSYVAERWGMTRHLPMLADAEQFLIQVRGAVHEL